MRLPVHLAGALALMALGCGKGGDGLDHQAVSGTVIIDGQPLDDGEIAFVPANAETDLNAAPAVGAKITAGAYAIERAGGPVPGPYKVSIFSGKPTGQKTPDDSDHSILYDVLAESIPDEYNKKTGLVAEVKAGDKNEFNYELKGRKDVTKARR